ncbi:MAG TPA: CHAD domain-containing protein, partial [Steroidobacteraceae bacterium]|nr:CHAD domain-containing protein [Steroidobacteraceae bacterium]
KAERGVRLARGVEAAPVKSVALALDDGMNVEDGFAAIVQGCLAQFQANLPGVLYPLPNPLPHAGEGANVMPTPPLPNPPPQAGEGANARPKPIDDIEYVHQARVALRRLRAALRLFRGKCVLPDELMGGLRTLASTLGPARDWDVLCTETLPEIAAHYADAAAWQRGADALEVHRAEVRAAMRSALAQAQPGAWLLAMQRWLLQHGWRRSALGNVAPEAQRLVQLSPLDKWARRALKKGHRRIARGARKFAQLQPPERHALRIAIKRQRYTAEFFQTLFGGKRQARYLAVLRDAQDSLGRANDAHIAQGLLAAVHTTPHVLQNVVDRSPLGQAETGPMRDFALGWLAAKEAGAGNGESAGHLNAFLALKPYW